MKKINFCASLLNGIPLQPADSRLAIAEWTAEGTKSGQAPVMIAPLHVHHKDDEVWYVLEGSLCFKIGDEEFEANADQAVVVPRGKPHTYWNPKPDKSRYLIIMPERIRALIDAIHSTEKRDLAAMKDLFARHDSEFIG